MSKFLATELYEYGVFIIPSIHVTKNNIHIETSEGVVGRGVG